MRRLLPCVFLAACGGDDAPPLSDATSLACPTPGALPFRTETRSFARSQNATLAEEDPRSKDEASDRLGVPGAAIASIYLGDADPVGVDTSFRGAKARTTSTGGLFSNPLPGEPVSLWSYDGAAWTTLGRTETDDDGGYELPDMGAVPNDGVVYAVLEGDGSCAEHHDLMLPAGSKVIVSDIDGTLTHDDGELLKQVVDEAYVQIPMGSAVALANAWATKRYPIVYLTARQHLLRNETRVWLRDLGFPLGPVISTNGGSTADVYKTAWMKRMLDDFGWNIVAVYGNADTDITAYENAGMPKDVTFIVGDLAGTRGTVAIPSFDFAEHIATFVAAQPDN